MTMTQPATPSLFLSLLPACLNRSCRHFLSLIIVRPRATKHRGRAAQLFFSRQSPFVCLCVRVKHVKGQHRERMVSSSPCLNNNYYHHQVRCLLIAQGLPAIMSLLLLHRWPWNGDFKVGDDFWRNLRPRFYLNWRFGFAIPKAIISKIKL